MQVATLFRESAKLLGASIDGSGMDTSKYILRSDAPADDGYETCLDAMCAPHPDRLMGASGHHFDPRHGAMDPGMRHAPVLQQQRPTMNPMKMEQFAGDPYSFVDEMPNMDFICNNAHLDASALHPSQPKKRGRRKKSDVREREFLETMGKGLDDKTMDAKERKRHDRFNGLSEEEVSRRTLPDHLAPNLDIIIVGINPGMFAAFKGHHYAGPGNHFWKCLYLSGLVPEPLTADDDFSLLNYGIGFTNMVARPTKGSADLTRKEIKQGSQILLEKLQKFRPKIAVFNGKLIYEVFSGKKDFPFGRQSEFVDGTNTYIWVMPSSSARCAQLPRAADKVPFYMALKKFRDYLNGLISEIDECEVVFHEPKPSSKSSILPNGELGKKSKENHNSHDSVTPNGELDPTVPVKKKRGRPRKGTEKNSDSAKLLKVKVESEGRGVEGSDKVGAPEEPQRKRRGRPKKVKPTDGVSPVKPASAINASDMYVDRTGVNASSVASCVAPKPSSVSSGYSTGTVGSMSSDDRCRRDENGSLSNAGSTGLSPSHHSFTTQSDLSSEISAAISCGSCPPSPLNNPTNCNNSNNNANSTNNNSSSCNSNSNNTSNNNNNNNNNSNSSSNNNNNTSSSSSSNNNNNNISSTNQTETVFDSLSMPNGQSRNPSVDHHHNKLLMNSMHASSQHEPPNCNNLYRPQAVNGVMTPHEQSFSQYHPAYDNRFQHISNRSQNYSIPTNNREEEEQQSMPNSSGFHGNSYENKCLDIATKSLSGLESLVDQIPSIADVEMGTSNVAAIPGDPSNPQPMQNIANQASHSGHFGESGSSGFLPYAHHSPASAYNSPSSHYPSPSYYPSELASSFPVNSSYCSPSPSLFAYPGYHGQYSGGNSGAGYVPPGHLTHSGYNNSSNYPASSYSGPNPYMQSHSPMNSPAGTAMPPGQRYTQRSFHLRPDNMDLGPLGYGGF